MDKLNWLTNLLGWSRNSSPDKKPALKKYSCFNLGCQAVFESINERDEHERKLSLEAFNKPWERNSSGFWLVYETFKDLAP